MRYRQKRNRSRVLARGPVWLTVCLLGILLPGCDSSTDIENVSAAGNWDGVGALQEAFPGVRLDLIEAPDGSVEGTWRRGGESSSVTGRNTAGNLELTLSGFGGSGAVFQGRFTNRLRMEGVLQGVPLSDAAVFRRTSF